MLPLAQSESPVSSGSASPRTLNGISSGDSYQFGVIDSRRSSPIRSQGAVGQYRRPRFQRQSGLGAQPRGKPHGNLSFLTHRYSASSSPASEARHIARFLGSWNCAHPVPPRSGEARLTGSLRAPPGKAHDLPEEHCVSVPFKLSPRRPLIYGGGDPDLSSVKLVVYPAVVPISLSRLPSSVQSAPPGTRSSAGVGCPWVPRSPPYPVVHMATSRATRSAGGSAAGDGVAVTEAVSVCQDVARASVTRGRGHRPP